MSVKIDGVQYLNTGYFDGMSVSENKETGNFSVYVQGIKHESDSKAFSNEIGDMSSCDKIMAVVQRYLDYYKINGFTELIELPRRNGKWNIVYGFMGNRLLHLQLFDPKFKALFQKIFDKYLQDRYNFCWDNPLNIIKLDFSSIYTRYDELEYFDDEYDSEWCKNGENYIRLTLKTDKDGNLLDFEQQFIKDYLYYKFWQVGEEAVVKGVYDVADSGYRTYKGTEIVCGDMRIFMSYPSNIQYICTLVINYNYQLSESKKINKRQLKMEEF